MPRCLFSNQFSSKRLRDQGISSPGPGHRCVRRGGGGVRGLLVVRLLSLAALFISAQSVASPSSVAPADDVASGAPPLEVTLLRPTTAETTPAAAVTSGSLDSHFARFDGYEATAPSETLWLRVRSSAAFNPNGQLPVLTARGGWFE